MLNIDKKTTRTEEGTWLPYDGSDFLIAHISNLRFQRLFQKYQQAYKRKIEAGTLDPAVSKEIICKAMSEGIVLDWRKVQNDTGQDVPYSAETAFGVLLNNAEFREWVSEASMNLANYIEDEVTARGKG